MPVVVDGMVLPDYEVRKRIDMVRSDAQELAGIFYDQCRSEKFRSAWCEVGLRTGRDPQRVFVEQQWKHFVEHVRAHYVAMLCHEKVRETDKRKIHQALVLQAMMSDALDDGSNTVVQSPVQLAPDTQQFEGDRYENKAIAETWGTRPSEGLVRKLMAGVAAIN